MNWQKYRKYYRRKWAEIRDDKFADWGKSVWFFEVNLEGFPTKQIEKYENGQILKYDLCHIQDEFGGLADQPIDLEEFSSFEITKEAFFIEWK